MKFRYFPQAIQFKCLQKRTKSLNPIIKSSKILTDQMRNDNKKNGSKKG